MVALPYALSVNHLVSTVGADAGLAAIVGLAVLVLLYFAQARETAALRDQVADCTDQVQELERRLAALARASSAASAPATAAPASHAPAPPPPGLNRPVVGAARMGAGALVASRASSPVPVPVPVPAGAPSAPAGVGAPALSAATRLIPAPDRHRFAVSAGAANSPGAADRAGAANPVGAAVLDPPAPRPATAAGGANGSAARAAPPRRSALPPSRPPGRAPGASSGGSRRSRPLLAALVLLAVIIVAVVLLVVRSGGSTPQSSATSRSASSAASAGTTRHHRTLAGALAPASVTVAVLNGTSVAHLAHKVALQLGQVGFKQGNVATAANQTMTTTVVGYLPGQRPAALLVAKQLKLGSASVGPVDQSNQTVACPASSTPCTAKVVVTVGSDRASTP